MGRPAPGARTTVGSNDRFDYIWGLKAAAAGTVRPAQASTTVNARAISRHDHWIEPHNFKDHPQDGRAPAGRCRWGGREAARGKPALTGMASSRRRAMSMIGLPRAPPPMSHQRRAQWTVSPCTTSAGAGDTGGALRHYRALRDGTEDPLTTEVAGRSCRRRRRPRRGEERCRSSFALPRTRPSSSAERGCRRPRSTAGHRALSGNGHTPTVKEMEPELFAKGGAGGTRTHDQGIMSPLL